MTIHLCCSGEVSIQSRQWSSFLKMLPESERCASYPFASEAGIGATKGRLVKLDSSWVGAVLSTMAEGGAYAVSARVPSTDDDHVLALGADVVPVCQVAV